MNTWGYLILITVLLLLAGVMLYARFASRSREKSLHHPPVEWVFLPEAISAAPVLERLPEPFLKEENHPEPLVRLDRVGSSDEALHDRGYFDELQEAAAGLAKLMRSSPVTRSEPVVFAPDIDAIEIVEEASAEAAELVEAPKSVLETVVESVVEDEVSDLSTETFIPMEAVIEETIAEETIAEDPVAELPARVLTWREIVGGNVADQFDRLDQGLDELELLVSGIAASLQTLGELERSEFDAISEDLADEAVAEAA